MIRAVPLTSSGSPSGEPAEDREGWEALTTLIRARLLVASLALPVGVLLRPDASVRGWIVMGWSSLVVGLLSVLFWIGVRWHRARLTQTYIQVACDLALVATLAAATGGRDSQFMLFFGLVAITAGLLAGVPGGLFGVLGSCLAVLAIPSIGRWLHLGAPRTMVGSMPPAGLMVAFLAVLGVLAGVLGDRVKRTRQDLEDTTRELDRVRLDQDVLLRHLTTGVLTVDAAGRVAYVNPAAEQVLGIRALAARDQHLQAALPDRLALLRESILDSLRHHSPRARAELMMEGPAGRPLPLGLSTNLLTHGEQVTGVVAVFQDLTEVREMERRVRRNETLAEVGALSAGIAHELRNGLKPISGSVECLQRELKLEGENAELMQLIANECTRLNRFVSDLLSYSRDRELALEAMDLDEHLHELCETLARDPRCAGRVRVRFEPGSYHGAVQADREQIRQVWLNLFNNALEAMPNGGDLTVRWREGNEGQKVIEFEDQGPGIAPENLSQIGRPFFTTKEGGTGLGIAIAQRIVERHGGTLSFDSVLHQGTTVRVSLPAVAAAAARAA
ncbi:MAG TPA: ATP-binding protein [Candidatus Udaeobacter sp.]|jgi:PAS domain S-box-containing protein|nr:ATP-binding protein [Candidatus Udaeobacter sp.]